MQRKLLLRASRLCLRRTLSTPKTRYADSSPLPMKNKIFLSKRLFYLQGGGGTHLTAALGERPPHFPKRPLRVLVLSSFGSHAARFPEFPRFCKEGFHLEHFF